MAVLFDELSRWRGRVAKEMGKPAYVVFDNKTLQAVADARPNNLAALGRIKGVGPKKLTDYGEAVLAIVAGDGGSAARGGPAASRGGTPAGSSSAAAAAAALFGSASRRPPPSNASSGATASAIATAFATASDSASASPSASATTTTTSISYETAKHNYETKMNPEQRAVVDAVLAGENVFFHGAAGTGKSFVLQTVVALVRGAGRGGDDSLVSVTAPTGIAAVGVGGVTVHKFIGAGLCAGHPSRVAAQVAKSKTATRRWRDTRTLVVDEVSMLDGDLLEKLDHVGRSTREAYDVPFGGLQLVFTGDFYQLPPVANAATTPPFAFATRAWSLAKFRVVELVRVLRQRDPRLVNALNDVRRGFVPVGGAASTLFRGLSRPLPPSAEGVLPTRLHSVNANVDAENQRELARLDGEAVTFDARDSGDDAGALETLRRNCPAPQSLTLKVGAQVVLLRNLDDSLVNGSRGVVKAFVGTRETEYVRHKCSFRIHPKLARAAETLFPRVPLVAFDNGRVVAVGPAQFDARGGGAKYAERLQMPLKLAWALTVHKSQGMTISRLEVSLRDAFDYGQVYVALSRATSVEGLRVTGFDEAKVRVHPRVAAFYESLDDAAVGGGDARGPIDGPSGERSRQSAAPSRGGYDDDRGAYPVAPTPSAAAPTPPSSYRTPLAQSGDTSDPTSLPRFGDASAGGSCFRCGRAGHWASRCPFANAGAANAASPARGFADGPSAYEGRGGDARGARGAGAFNRPVAHAGDWRLGGYTTNDPPSP